MAQIVYPTMRYDDPDAAVDWLQRRLGFEERVVYRNDDGGIVHAELAFGGQLVMLGPADTERAVGPAWTYLVTAEPDALYERAVEAGAEVVQEITEQDYGAREFTIRDPGGNLWSAGTYQPNG